MKKLLLLTITAFLTVNVWGQTADKIIVKDTRDINDGPNQFVQEVIFEFKRRSALGIPGTGSYSGMMTFAPWKDDTGDASHQLNFNEGGIYYRTGQPSETNWDIWRQLIITDENGNVGIGTTSPNAKLDVNGNAVFGTATRTTLYGHIIGFSRNSANYIWAEATSGYLLFGVNGASKGIAYSAMHIDAAKTTRFYGSVGIGTSSISIPNGYKFAVDGKIICEEVRVDMSDNWADFVFEDDYHLMPLQELDSYIQENRHLPEIPTAEEVEENGISVGEMNAKLLQKIEELTLYLIEKDKEVNELRNEINKLDKLINEKL